MTNITPNNIFETFSIPTVEGKSYWTWFGVSLFLLFPLDIITTKIAMSIYGKGKEMNPIITKLFESGGIELVVLAHIVILTVAIGIFCGLIHSLKNADNSYTYALFEVWLGLIVSFGVFVILNNTLIILLDFSLVDIIIPTLVYAYYEIFMFIVVLV